MISVICVLHFSGRTCLCLDADRSDQALWQGSSRCGLDAVGDGRGFPGRWPAARRWGGFERRILTVILGITLLGASLAAVGERPPDGLLGPVAAVFVAGVMAPIVVGSFQAISRPSFLRRCRGASFARHAVEWTRCRRSGDGRGGPRGRRGRRPALVPATGGVMVLMAGAMLLVRAVMRLERQAQARHAAEPNCPAPWGRDVGVCYPAVHGRCSGGICRGDFRTRTAGCAGPSPRAGGVGLPAGCSIFVLAASH